MENEVTKRRGIPASVLKNVAILTMLIDHIGAALVEFKFDSIQDYELYQQVYVLYMVLRLIGRLGFPLFCFLLVEGFSHTRSVLRYARNLLIFALISEVPFDLAFYHMFFAWGHQNIYWTLLIGVLAMLCADKIWKSRLHTVLRVLCTIAVSAGFIAAAQLCRTDYGGWGVAVILVMYFLRRWRVVSAAAGCGLLTIMQLIEAPSFLTLPLIGFYNGTRGRQNKWFFYIFYPAHLLLLYLVYLLLKNHGIL